MEEERSFIRKESVGQNSNFSPTQIGPTAEDLTNQRIKHGFMTENPPAQSPAPQYQENIMQSRANAV